MKFKLGFSQRCQSEAALVSETEVHPETKALLEQKLQT